MQRQERPARVRSVGARRDLTEVEQKGEMSRNVCGPLVDKGGFGFVPPHEVRSDR